MNMFTQKTKFFLDEIEIWKYFANNRENIFILTTEYWFFALLQVKKLMGCYFKFILQKTKTKKEMKRGEKFAFSHFFFLSFFYVVPFVLEIHTYVCLWCMCSHMWITTYNVFPASHICVSKQIHGNKLKTSRSV